MAKLSKTQQDILDKMRDGWELGQYEGLYSECVIQQGGLGRGGITRTVSIASLYALNRMGIIEVANRKYPLTHYKLKEESNG